MPVLKASTSMSTAYVYRGEGAGWRSVKSTCESIERLLAGPLRQHIKPLKVDSISTDKLLEGRWTQHTALLVMPGGADLPYCKHLNGHGNRIIRDFVESGGSYLGLCAGAYYACKRVVFEPGTPLEVVGDRELAFFPGIARGAAYPGFDYLTEAGAVAAAVEFTVPVALQHAHPVGQEQQHRGPSPLPASHSPQPHSTATTWDYCNGGPYFTAVDGDPDIDQLQGVRVLAKYCDVPAAASLSVQHQQQQPAVNGNGVAAVLLPGQPQELLIRRAAAVRCHVGKGVAVLCGTHPELGPEWLDPCGESNAAQGPQPHQQVPVAAVAAGSIGSTSAKPQQQEKQPQGDWQTQVLQTADVHSAGGVLLSNSNGGDSPSSQPMQLVCRDIALATHAQHLKRELQASQEGRDLLLSSLLYEALVRPS